MLARGRVRRTVVVVVALVATLITLPGGAAGAATNRPFLRVGTWDTALRPWLATPERQQAVNDVIAGSDQDVLALQGVWGQSARDAVLGDPRIAARYPYSYWVPANQQFAYCALDVPRSDLEDLLSIIIVSGTDPRQLLQPTTPVDPISGFVSLGIAFRGQQICLEAIYAGVQQLPAGADPFDVIDQAYFQGTVKYAQDSDTGLLVLSDKPITDPSVYQPDTFLQRAATVYATIDGTRFAFADWPHNMFETIEEGAGYLDTGAQQTDFANDLLAHDVDIVVGELASGPGYQSAAYDSLTSNGFTPTYTGVTRCPDATHSTNPICANTNVYEIPNNTSVDNVLTTHPDRCWSSHAFATSPVSDHIGVSVTCAKQADTTAPVVTPTVTGTQGTNGWYTSDVGLSWTLTEPESEVTASNGCGAATLTNDTTGQNFTCRATSPGGTSSASISIKRDATRPVVTVSGGPVDGATYYTGTVPTAPTCSAVDATSGTAPPGCSVSGYSTAVGPHTISYTAADNAGNRTALTRSYSVLADTTAPVSSVTAAPGTLKAGQKLTTVTGTATVKTTKGATVGTFSATCWNTTGTVLTIAPTDSQSGVASLTYSTTGSTVTAPTTTSTPPLTITVANTGITTVSYAAKDRAGNQETTRQQTVITNAQVPFTCTGPTPSFTPPAHGTINLTLVVNGRRVTTTFTY